MEAKRASMEEDRFIEEVKKLKRKKLKEFVKKETLMFLNKFFWYFLKGHYIKEKIFKVLIIYWSIKNIMFTVFISLDIFLFFYALSGECIHSLCHVIS